MSKNSSAKYYQNNKEIIQKKLVKDIKVFLSKKKKKSDNMVVNDTKIFQKMENKSLLSIEENMKKLGKTFYYDYNDFFSVDINNLESSFDEKYKDVLKNQF